MTGTANAQSNLLSQVEVELVVPVFNEAPRIGPFASAVTAALKEADFAWSALFVDDGSRDQSLEAIRGLAAKDRRFRGLSLSRNFGKEAAIAAGLRRAASDAVIVMDCDLQHPPEIILKFVEAWRAGALVVFGQRQNRVGEGLMRRTLSRLFYLIFRLLSETSLPEGAIDFVLLDRRAVDAFNLLGERTRFTKGLFAWIGFRSALVPVPIAARGGGGSRFGFARLGRFALDGLSSFSSLPLKVWSYVGVLISTIALLYGLAFLAETLIYGIDVPGFPSLIVSIMFFSGVQLISLGVIGEYLARVYGEVKGRPLFLIAEEIGQTLADREASQVERALRSGDG